MSAAKMFSTGIIAMLFYSISITMLTHSLPPTELNFIVSFDFGEKAITTNYSELTKNIEENMSKQKKVGVADVGSLVLYSGNLVLDLFLNFMNAIPSMATLLFKIIFLFVPIESNLAAQFNLGVYAIISSIWIITLIFFITQVRTQTGIA